MDSPWIVQGATAVVDHRTDGEKMVFLRARVKNVSSMFLSFMHAAFLCRDCTEAQKINFSVPAGVSRRIHDGHRNSPNKACGQQKFTPPLVRSWLTLCFVGAGPTSLQLAVLALENVPMRTRMTHVAVPNYKGRIGFDHFEGMITTTGAWNCHADCRMRNFDRE